MTFARFISDAELCAFLDGEVSPARAAEIATAVRCDPHLQNKLKAWRAQNQWLRASFGRIAQEPVPAMLTQALPVDRATPPPPQPERPRMMARATESLRPSDTLTFWKIMAMSLAGLFFATVLYASGVVTGTQACAPTLIQKWMAQPKSLRGS